MSFLPRHTNFELPSTGLHYRVFCTHAFGPFPEDGMAGDLYLVPDRKQLFCKEILTPHMQGHWRLVANGKNIEHPFEASHQLIINAALVIQWSQNPPEHTCFQRGIHSTAKMILSSEPDRRHVDVQFQVIIEED